MGFFGKVFSSFGSFLDDCIKNTGDLLKQVTTQDKLDRLASVAYLVASADGSVDPEETQKFAQVVTRSCPHFTAAQASEAFNKAANQTKGKLLASIGQANDEEADLLVRAGVAIGGADGDFDDNEKAVVREICNELFLQPSKYGL